jgi:hypothetical protein
MVSEPDRDRGVLSKRDRRFLYDATEEQRKNSTGRATRSEIRSRIYNSILDFKILTDELGDRDRQNVFEDFGSDRELRRGAIAALAFLYQSLEEQSNDFSEVLVPAVERGERAVTRGEIEDDVGVEVEVKFDVETKLLLSEPDPAKYSDEEIGEMLADGRIDREDALELLQARVDRDSEGDQ